MLKRLYIDNVRCFSNFEMTPSPIAVLVGANGTGKSTLGDVLSSLLSLLQPEAPSVQHLFPPHSCTRWDTRNVQRIELRVEAEQEQFDYSLEIEHDADRRTSVIRSERLLGSGQLLYSVADGEVQLFGDNAAAHPRVTFPVDPRRSFLPILEPRQDNRRITAFKRWLAGCWRLKLRPEQMDPFSKEEAATVSPDGHNFPSWYRTLQQEAPDVTERVRGDLTQVIPGLKRIRLVAAGDSKLLMLDFLQDGQEFSLHLGELSDGQRALLVLYTILHAAADRTCLLVIDEPDNFVADREIQPWLSSLRERVADAAKGTLLVMSHHPEVVDYLAADQVLRLSREGGPTRIESLEGSLDRKDGLKASEWLRLDEADG